MPAVAHEKEAGFANDCSRTDNQECTYQSLNILAIASAHIKQKPNSHIGCLSYCRPSNTFCLPLREDTQCRKNKRS
jgi:hypothetical protein